MHLVWAEEKEPIQESYSRFGQTTNNNYTQVKKNGKYHLDGKYSNCGKQGIAI